MIRIPALDVILEQDTLNRIAQERLPKTDAVRSLSIELHPGKIHLNIDGNIPILGDRNVTAELSVEVRGNELWLRLERTNVPLIPKGVIVGAVASMVNLAGLRAEGSSLVLDLIQLFAKYEVDTRVNTVLVDRGTIRLLCLT